MPTKVPSLPRKSRGVFTLVLVARARARARDRKASEDSCILRLFVIYLFLGSYSVAEACALSFGAQVGLELGAILLP